MRKTLSLDSLSQYGIELLFIGFGFFLISYSLADITTTLSIFLTYFALWLVIMTGSLWSKWVRNKRAQLKEKRSSCLVGKTVAVEQ